MYKYTIFFNDAVNNAVIILLYKTVLYFEGDASLRLNALTTRGHARALAFSYSEVIWTTVSSVE